MSEPEEVIEIDEEGRVHRPRDIRYDAGHEAGYKAAVIELALLARVEADQYRANSAEWEERETVKVCPGADALDKFAAELETLGQGATNPGPLDEIAKQKFV